MRVGERRSRTRKTSTCFGSGGGLGFPENLSANGEIALLFAREVASNQGAVGAAEIVDAVRSVLSDENFPVG